ncbi:MAG: mechanosensitive ion channel [Nanoarchaeota archaeon]|nr:mechanosensitive ion channel [Nanoarchaeota archaeon]
MVDLQSLFGLSTISALIIKLIASLVIILLGLIIGRIIGKLINKVLHSFEIDKILGQSGIKFPFERFISSISRYIVYFIGLIWGLAELGLTTIILEIILVIILILLVSFIILAFKDFVPNITAGFFIHHKNALKKGDIIKVRHIEGEIIEIDLIETKIKAKNGEIILIPNSMLTTNEITKK